MDWPSTIILGANVATSVGVFFAAAGLWVTKVQAVTAYEDSISTEYRQLIKNIPIEALLGEHLSEGEAKSSLTAIYNYIDFTNEQIYLRQRGRIRKATWHSWAEGIASNMRRVAFKEAWEMIKAKSPDSFTELRTLEANDFMGDPKAW